MKTCAATRIVVYATFYTKIKFSRHIEKFFCPPAGMELFCSMKSYRFLFLILLLPFFSSLSAQPTDPQLQSRLNEYMKLNRELNFSKLMEYVHPKLFKLASKEQMIEVMESSFRGNDDMEIALDSLETGKIYPAFTLQNGTYAKVDYSMLMRMKIKKDSGGYEPVNDMMLSLFRSQYGKDNVRYDEPTQAYVIRIVSVMVAIKDEQSPEWSFLNFKPGDAVMKKLLSQEVINKLNSN